VTREEVERAAATIGEALDATRRDLPAAEGRAREVGASRP
jgi:hypothetical protein